MKSKVAPARRGAAEASQWYKDAVIYEVHVRAFADSDGDGIGDLRGLLSKLEYLADLGITAVWLLPLYPSPLRDDGYDIADYNNIHPSYGTLKDFKAVLAEAHRLGLRVITELVLNHTSDQHPWFQRARRAKPGSAARDFYVWNDSPDKYTEARIIFKDFETSNWAWDPVAGSYYWHRFYSHQPDLNFDNPAVRDAMMDVLDFWFDMGVDGLRLDAVPYLFEREGTNGENLKETHEFLRELREHVEARYGGEKMLLAEANQWPEDAAAYFGDGDECHMAFHFPLMPRMFMATRLEDRFPIIDILEQTPEIPDGAQWALFLRNHDELTLEMVTDEERDYMYRVYAADPQARINLGIRRRLAPLLGNNRRMIEMMNGLLFSLPGTPVMYYGDEIGMGDNIYLGDRNGVRTPMQWSADRNAGFSRANPQKLFLPVIIDPEYHAEALNVEAQRANPHSLLWWTKRLIALRKQSKALSRGSFKFLYPENPKVLAYVREHDDERVLVVANLSRHAQYAELDLRDFDGMVPVEMFGGTDFPPVGELPYLVTLGPHAVYWLALEDRAGESASGGADGHPLIEVAGAWTDALARRGGRGPLERVLPGWLRTRRWFGSKGRKIKAVDIDDTIPLSRTRGAALGVLAILTIEYTEGESETYALPLVWRAGEEGHEPPTVIARIRCRDGDGVLFDGLSDPDLCQALLSAIATRRTLRGAHGDLTAAPTRAFRATRGPASDDLDIDWIGAEQSNTSVVYGDRLVLKLIRHLTDGTNPDLEIGRYLSEQTAFDKLPRVAGAIEYSRGRGEASTVGILTEYVENEGDAWSFTLGQLGLFVERVLAAQDGHILPVPSGRLLDLATRTPPDEVAELIGPYLAGVELLAGRTAEMHLALGGATDDAAFLPEPMTMLYQRSMYQSMRSLARRTFQMVRAHAKAMPDVEALVDYEDDILARFGLLLEGKIDALRIRTHGDYHLGQVLWTGKDFVIIDFEGEPARSLGERRLKRSPLRDVAGMIRSFHYAAYTALYGQAGGVSVRPEDRGLIEPRLRAWYRWVSAAFLREYWDRCGDQPFLPQSRRDLEVMLDALLLEKAIYELVYEINNRPDWVAVPLRGIFELLEDDE